MTADVLFLCPHNAAKGVIAAALFNQLAAQAGLPLTADSAGTEPDEVVSPTVVAMLARDGMDVAGYIPRLVTDDELGAVPHVISMGCTPEELTAAGDRVEYWSDIPPVSQDPDAAHKAIAGAVTRLFGRLRGQS